jgi:hypothetical protein
MRALPACNFRRSELVLSERVWMGRGNARIQPKGAFSTGVLPPRTAQPESVTVRAKRSEQAGLGGGRLGANGDGVGVLATAE